MRIYDDPEYSIEVVTELGDRVRFHMDKIQENSRQTKSGIIDVFVSSLVEDREPPISGEAVLSAMRVVFASFEASERNETVRIIENL